MVEVHDCGCLESEVGGAAEVRCVHTMGLRF